MKDVEAIRDVNIVFLSNRFLVVEDPSLTKMTKEVNLLKTGFKPVFSFTGLHRKLHFKPS